MSTSNDHHLKAVIDAIDYSTNQRLAQARKNNLGARAEEIALSEADEAKRKLRKIAISFETATPTTVEATRRPEHNQRLIRVRGSLAGMDDPAQVELAPTVDASITDLLGQRPDETNQASIKALTSVLVIKGESEGVITTKPFIDRQLISSIQDLGGKFANWEFLIYVTVSTTLVKTGDPAASMTNVGQFEFYIVDARPLETALQIVAPTPGEQEAAMKLYGTNSDPMQTAIADVTALLEVAEADRLPILTEALQVQVLAAATEGQRCHSLLIGPPGVGKSLVAKVAKLVEPVAKYALPTKVTEAGLIGDGHSNKKNRRPGLVPQAHTGAFVVEDFNQANSVKNQRMISTFTHVMSEGCVSDASAAKVEYRAEVSIHLDVNRKSDVRRTGSKKEGFDRAVEDFGVPMNVLSRMTYIAEIPRDAATQLAVAGALILTKGHLTEAERNFLRERIQLLRVYLALMRDKHRTVQIPQELRQVVYDRVMLVVNTTQARFEQHPELADFFTRLGDQALMLTCASARLHNRSVACVADVDAIFPFLWRKMDWIKTTLFGGQAETAVVNTNAKARRHLIRLRLACRAKKTCTASEIKRLLGLHSASHATITEDLQALLGDPDEKGVYIVVLKENDCA